jgi:uncharacterized membrane protein YtjA (UPF0391 family)
VLELQRGSSVGYQSNLKSQEWIMLSWALVFLVLALVAAAFGFGGIAGTATSIAQLLFVGFLVLTVITFVVRALQGRSIL